MSVTVFLLLIISLEAIESHFLVNTLPGFTGDLPFTLETGYIGVGESELFYYFIESESNPKDDPLIFWLTGGPGCSGLSALLYEIGPLTVNYANSTLEETILEINPHRWTKVASIIFVDQPAGTGFAYAKTPEAYITNDTLSAMQAYSFLKKWLVDHPKLLNNPLYVAADSFMGILLPMIVQEIYNGNEVGEGPQINIKGYSLGNPLTDTGGDYNSRIRYAHRMALLSDAIYKSAEESCDGEYWKIDPNNSLCIQALQVVDKCIGRIRLPQILEPHCDDSNTLKFYLSRRGLGTLDKIFMDIWSLPQVQKQSCRNDNYIYSYVWANNRDVREALHVHEEFGDTEWVRCNDSFHFYYDKEAISYTHNVLSTVDYHRRISDKHCRALIYSGDHDMVVPYINTLDWIESLNLSVVDGWRPWFVDEQVAGYTMKYSKNNYHLTFATVKGYSLGNPLTDTGGDYNSRIRYVHRMALLSDAIYKSAEESCDGEYWKIDPNNSLCIQALQVVDKCIGRIRLAQILEPYCYDSNTLKLYLSRRGLGTLDKIFMDIWSLPQVQEQSCRNDNYIYPYVWANNRDVREALHVHEEFGDTEWERCNDSLYFYFDKEAISYTHNVLSTVDYHRRISDKHCRALIYSGDHDMIVPYISTLDWIESLNLSVVDGWRPWFVDEQVAGYTMKYSKHNYHLTFATVKGGGHTAPEYKPKECLSMFMRWLANDSL